MVWYSTNSYRIKSGGRYRSTLHHMSLQVEPDSLAALGRTKPLFYENGFQFISPSRVRFQPALLSQGLKNQPAKLPILHEVS